MTGEETLKELERGLNEINPDEWHKHVSRFAVAAVVQDARDLRSLLEALPKCCSNECDRIATHVASTYGGDFADEFDCDEHAQDGEDQELPYAPVLRRIAARG